MLYLDTSAFLKLLVEEEHSSALRRSLRGVTPWSSTLLAVEAHRAALRLSIAPSEVDARLEVVTFVVPSETAFVSARSVGVVGLGALDALHLASAMELGDDLEAVITYDQRLAAGCAHHEIEVSSPGLASRWWES